MSRSMSAIRLQCIPIRGHAMYFNSIAETCSPPARVSRSTPHVKQTREQACSNGAQHDAACTARQACSTQRPMVRTRIERIPP